MNRLTDAIHLRGWTQETAAEHLGKSVRTIKRLAAECGNANPLVLVRQLACDLRVSADYLVGMPPVQVEQEIYRVDEARCIGLAVADERTVFEGRQLAARVVSALQLRCDQLNVPVVVTLVVTPHLNLGRYTPVVDLLYHETMEKLLELRTAVGEST